jgi:hypothetical protein
MVLFFGIEHKQSISLRPPRHFGGQVEAIGEVRSSRQDCYFVWGAGDVVGGLGAGGVSSACDPPTS